MTFSTKTTAVHHRVGLYAIARRDPHRQQVRDEHGIRDHGQDGR